MREIKFRGQMTTGELVYGLPHLDLPGSTAYYNECSYRICWNTDTGGSANAPIKNGTLMQFTGLQDKNGKDIYEGDVIIVGNKRAIVTFDNACFRTKIGVSNYRLGGWKKIEVVGNIYENKELLTP